MIEKEDSGDNNSYFYTAQNNNMFLSNNMNIEIRTNSTNYCRIYPQNLDNGFYKITIIDPLVNSRQDYESQKCGVFYMQKIDNVNESQSHRVVTKYQNGEFIDEVPNGYFLSIHRIIERGILIRINENDSINPYLKIHYETNKTMKCSIIKLV